MGGGGTPGGETEAASVAHMRLWVRVYTPMRCSLPPVRPCVLITTGRLIVQLPPARELLGWELVPIPSAPPITLCPAKMLSAGTPAPHPAAGEGPLVGCTQHQAAQGFVLLLLPECKAAPACMLAAAVLLPSAGPQPLPPCISLWLLYPAPSRLPPHAKEPWGWGERSCHGAFL